jgi:hypothetical protein
MKRSEAIEVIGKVLTYGKSGFPPEKRHAYEKKSLADTILTELESLGMFYCPVENLGDFGQLRTPKGWEPENEKK